jgi:hypothetical protein
VYLKVNPDELRQRLAQRKPQADANPPFPITAEILENYLSAFEQPPDEGGQVLTSS